MGIAENKLKAKKAAKAQAKISKKKSLWEKNKEKKEAAKNKPALSGYLAKKKAATTFFKSKTGLTSLRRKRKYKKRRDK